MPAILSLTEFELPRHECEKLEEQIRQAYKSTSPKISKLLRVLKDDPKQLVESLTTFTLDSGRKFLVIERLDKPNGLIAELIVQELTTDGPTNERRYDSFGNLSPYCLAEREIMSLALAEERAETD